MNRLEHVIRAAATISGDSEIVVVGSQAILGRYPDAPAELLVSADADVYPRHHPERSDLVDGAIGELSAFHDMPRTMRQAFWRTLPREVQLVTALYEGQIARNPTLFGPGA